MFLYERERAEITENKVPFYTSKFFEVAQRYINKPHSNISSLMTVDYETCIKREDIFRETFIYQLGKLLSLPTMLITHTTFPGLTTPYTVRTSCKSTHSHCTNYYILTTVWKKSSCEMG